MLDKLLQLCGFGSASSAPAAEQRFSADEVRQHNTETSLWIVRGKDVYDVTSLVHEHPGGMGALLRRGGGAADCTEDFHFHSRRGKAMWQRYKIGVLIGDPAALRQQRVAAAVTAPSTAAPANSSVAGPSEGSPATTSSSGGSSSNIASPDGGREASPFAKAAAAAAAAHAASVARTEGGAVAATTAPFLCEQCCSGAPGSQTVATGAVTARTHCPHCTCADRFQ